jgi:hypothetical protein
MPLEDKHCIPHFLHSIITTQTHISEARMTAAPCYVVKLHMVGDCGKTYASFVKEIF